MRSQTCSWVAAGSIYPQAPDALRDSRLQRDLDEFDALLAVPTRGVFDDLVGAGGDFAVTPLAGAWGALVRA